MADEQLRDDVERQGDEHGQREGKPGEPKPGAGAPAGPLGKKGKDRKTAVLVILTAAGVLIAWLSLRKPSSASSTDPSASSATNPLNYPQSNGDVAGYGGDQYGFDPNAYAGLQTMIGNISTQLNTLQTQVNALPKSGSSGTNADPHTLAALRAQVTIENREIVQARGKIKSAKTSTERKRWTDIGNYWHGRLNATQARLNALGG